MRLDEEQLSQKDVQFSGYVEERRQDDEGHSGDCKAIAAPPEIERVI